MAFGRRKSSETTSSSAPAGELRRTMPTRFAPGDDRAQENPPTYQSSRGGWLTSPPKPVPGTPQP